MSTTWRRLGVMAVISLLHVALIVVAWKSTMRIAKKAREPREMAWLFSTPPQADNTKDVGRQDVDPADAKARRSRHSSRFVLTVPEPGAGPDIVGVGDMLRTCTLENIGNLSDDERERCKRVGLGVTRRRFDGSDLLEHPSRARQHERWARALALRKAPLLLPCMNAEGLGVSIGTVLCLADGFANGFDLQNSPLPTYADANDGDERDVPFEKLGMPRGMRR